MADRFEASFCRRLASLPSLSRRLLLVAAAEPTGDPALVWRAAAQVGVTGSAAEAVADEGLLDMNPRVTFRHPLFGPDLPRVTPRSNATHSLAAATDPALDLDRRAWYFSRPCHIPTTMSRQSWSVSGRACACRGGLLLRHVSGAVHRVDRRAGAARQRALVAAEAKRQAGALDDALRRSPSSPNTGRCRFSASAARRSSRSALRSIRPWK